MSAGDSWREWVEIRSKDVRRPPRASQPRKRLPSAAQRRGQSTVEELDALGEQARAAGERGDHVRAAELFAELTSLAAQTLGPDHPAVLSAEASWAAELGFAGEPCAAAGQLAEIVDRMVRLLGPDDPRAAAAAAAAVSWDEACQSAQTVEEHFVVPPELRYTIDSLWVSEPPLARVGLTSASTEDAGRVLEVEWQVDEGENVVQDQMIAGFTVSRVSDPAKWFYILVNAPIAGQVTKVNPLLRADFGDAPEHGDVLVEDPYGEGWIVELLLNREGEKQFAKLFTAAQISGSQS